MINYSRRWCTRHVSKQQRCVSVAWKNCATETTVAKEPHNGASLIFVRRSTAIEKRAASVPRDHDFSCSIWLTFLFRSTEVTVDRVRKFLFGCNHIFCHVGWRTVNYSDTRANYAWRFAEPAKFGAFQFVCFLNHSDTSWVSGNTVTKTLFFFFFFKERERELSVSQDFLKLRSGRFFGRSVRLKILVALQKFVAVIGFVLRRIFIFVSVF